jgi:plasmid replication initiation protein
MKSSPMSGAAHRLRDYQRLKAALDRLQSTTISTSIRQPAEGPPSPLLVDQRVAGAHRPQRTAGRHRADRARLVLQAVLDDALVLTIDPAYFDLTGGLDRWLYRIVRKHGGRQRNGWRFDFRHLHQKSGSLSPFKRFAFELRDIIRRQPLPGYVLFARGRDRRAHAARLRATPACGKPVDGLVLSGTRTIVPSGTRGSCHQEPKPALTSGNQKRKSRP